MDALLRATFSHRTRSFWAWVALLAVAVLISLWALARLLSGGQEMAHDAFANGQRVMISIHDGRITGNFVQRRSAEEDASTIDTTTTEAPAAVVDPAPAEPAPAAPEAPAAEATPPAEATAPEATKQEEKTFPPTMPAARIPPQDKPDVHSKDLNPLATTSQPASATPAAPAVEAPTAEQAAATAPTPAEPAPAKQEEAPQPLPAATPTGTKVERPLAAAPQKKLVETLPGGITLPRIAEDGTTPMQAYAKAAPAGITAKNPRIAIVVLQVGLNQALAKQIMALPEDITLSVSPYAAKAASWVEMARTHGHEALLDLPMEPKEYPISDAGTLALSPREKATSNIDRLRESLQKAQGYVGVVGTPGEHFLNQPQHALTALEEIGKRGIFLLSTNPRAAITLAQLERKKALTSLPGAILLDGSAGAESLQKQLQQLAETARKDGYAIALLRPTPVALTSLTNWMNATRSATPDIAFVPVSSLINFAPAH